MNERLMTATGPALLLLMIALFVIMIVVPFFRLTGAPGPSTSNFAYKLRTIIWNSSTITLFTTSAVVFGIFGLSNFTQVYAPQSTAVLLPIQPGDSLGSPYLTINERNDRVTFTVRNKAGALKSLEVPITSGAADTGGFIADDPVASIVDDATAETARFEVESCMVVNVDGASGPKPSENTCTGRQTLHIPRIETPAQ